MAELNSNELQQLQKQYENRPMSVGNWFVTILIMAIPVVGLIMLFVWAFGDMAPQSKRNWARAQLIWMLIAFVLVFLFYVTIFSTLYRGGYGF